MGDRCPLLLMSESSRTPRGKRPLYFPGRWRATVAGAGTPRPRVSGSRRRVTLYWEDERLAPVAVPAAGPAGAPGGPVDVHPGRSGGARRPRPDAPAGGRRRDDAL